MLITSSLVLLLLGSLGSIQTVRSAQIPENPPADPNCRDPAVAAFSATLYTAMLFSNDPNIFLKLNLAGKDASTLLYQVLLEELNYFAVCNAKIVAKTVAKGAAFLKVFYLSDYIRLKGFTVGDYLKQQNVLNCDNAIELAFAYFNLVQGLLDGSDGTLVESYMKAVTGGLLTWMEQLKLNLVEASHDLSFLFYKEFSQA